MGHVLIYIKTVDPVKKILANMRMRRSEFRSRTDVRVRRSGVAQLEIRVFNSKQQFQFRDFYFWQILAKLALVIVPRQQNRHYFISYITEKIRQTLS